MYRHALNGTIQAFFEIEVNILEYQDLDPLEQFNVQDMMRWAYNHLKGLLPGTNHPEFIHERYADVENLVRLRG